MTALPRLPQSFSRPDLEDAGFVGWLSWAQVRAGHLVPVPASPAAYVIYRVSGTDPEFLPANPAGRFKGKDPTVSLEALKQNWVPGTPVVYIGKANSANRRLSQFARFGGGEPVGHWGGRYIWQLADSEDLLIAWHPVIWNETARDYEKRLLAEFAELHNGSRPFANLMG